MDLTLEIWEGPPNSIWVSKPKWILIKLHIVKFFSFLYNGSMEQSNIIKYVEESLLSRLDDKSQAFLYLVLARGFESLGDKSLVMTHTELARKFSIDSRGNKRKEEHKKKEEEESFGIDMTWGEEPEEVKVEPEVVEESLEFTPEEYIVLSDKNNWFLFLKNSMIQHFISNQVDLVNQVNLRKKMNSLLLDGGKTVDISLVKMLNDTQNKNEKSGVVHYSSAIMPRWDLDSHSNKEDWVSFFEGGVLKHLSIDGYSAAMDIKEEDKDA